MLDFMGNSKNIKRNIVELKNVYVYYKPVFALDNVSISINKGEFVSVIGPNGSGKSTLLNVILGRVIPQKGEVKIFGRKPAVARNKIGYLPQKETFDPYMPFVVKEVVMMGRYSHIGLFKKPHNIDYKLVMDALKSVEMEHKQYEPIGHLSGGERQRIFIARALVGNPEILLLDEPTTGLDVKTQRSLISLIAKIHKGMGITIIMVTHNINFLSQYLDRVIYLKNKVYLDGVPEDILTSDKLSELYGAPVEVFEKDGQVCVMVEDSHSHPHLRIP